MPIEVKIDAKELKRAASILRARAGGNLLRGLESLMRREMQLADRELVLNLTNKVLKRRTGNLARSVRHGVQRTADRVIGSFGILKPGPAQRYAGIHITGGVIRPRTARMLAIPLPAVQTKAGVSRYSSPRQVEGLFLIKSKAGNLLLVKRSGKGITPFFVLKSQVVIPQRDYFTPARTVAIRRVTEGARELLAGAVSLKE